MAGKAHDTKGEGAIARKRDEATWRQHEGAKGRKGEGRLYEGVTARLHEGAKGRKGEGEKGRKGEGATSQMHEEEKGRRGEREKRRQSDFTTTRLSMDYNVRLTQKIFTYFLNSGATKFIYFSSVKAVTNTKY